MTTELERLEAENQRLVSLKRERYRAASKETGARRKMDKLMNENAQLRSELPAVATPAVSAGTPKNPLAVALNTLAKHRRDPTLSMMFAEADAWQKMLGSKAPPMTTVGAVAKASAQMHLHTVRTSARAAAQRLNEKRGIA